MSVLGDFKGRPRETEVLPQCATLAGGMAQTFTVESLHLLLLHTFSADEAHRKHAEGQLEQLVGSPGAPVLLLQIVAHHEQVQREVRQASAIALKNMIKKGWDKDSVTRRARGAAAASGPVVVSPEDKVNGRHALLLSLIHI